jgi:hypothetical protein
MGAPSNVGYPTCHGHVTALKRPGALGGLRRQPYTADPLQMATASVDWTSAGCHPRRLARLRP